MKNSKSIISWIVVLVLIVSSISCKQASDLKAFTEANYNLKGIEDLRLNGVDVTDKRTPFDFRTTEGDSLLAAFTTNKLKATTTLYLDVQMPNPKITRTMEVTNLQWQLLVDGKETLTGKVLKPMTLHNGVNKLPLSSTVTLAEVDGLQNYEGFSMLTTLVAKGKEVQNRLTFRIKPTINTPVGDVTVPEYITVGQPASN